MTEEARMVLIETERLFVRQWVPDDWKRFRPLGTDPRVLQHLHTEPWSDERIQRFITRGIEVAKTRGWILWPVRERGSGNTRHPSGWRGGPHDQEAERGHPLGPVLRRVPPDVRSD
jgi:hypothetical protein